MKSSSITRWNQKHKQACAKSPWCRSNNKPQSLSQSQPTHIIVPKQYKRLAQHIPPRAYSLQTGKRMEEHGVMLTKEDRQVWHRRTSQKKQPCTKLAWPERVQTKERPVDDDRERRWSRKVSPSPSHHNLLHQLQLHGRFDPSSQPLPAQED